MLVILMPAGIILVLYLLYAGGLMTLSMKRAVVFSGTLPRKRHWGARFVSCSGWVKRRIRFEKKAVYCFELQTELQAGELAAELLDRESKVLMRLDDQHRRMCIDTSSAQRCSLIVRMKSATGKYVLSWDPREEE